jgi:hypothetical protein
MVNKGAIGAFGALAAIGVLLAVGCGGSGSEEAQSKADFVREGSAICGKWQQARSTRLQEVPSKLKPPVTQAKKEKALLFILEPYGDVLHGLKELDPPAGEEEKVEAMIKAAGEGYAQGQANPRTLMNDNVAFRKADELFEAYGLNACQA